MNIIRKFFRFRESSLILINLAIIIIMAVIFPNFTTSNNIFGMLYAVSVNSIIAGAMTVLFVSGGFDMAAGATLGYCGMMVGFLMTDMGLSIPVAIILTILVGAVLGSVMGYIISYLNINPFVVTLAGWFIIESFIYIIGGGTNKVGFSKSFALLSSILKDFIFLAN